MLAVGQRRREIPNGVGEIGPDAPRCGWKHVNSDSAGPKHAQDLRLKRTDVRDMFEGVGTEHAVEALIFERNGVTIVLTHRPDPFYCIVARGYVDGFDRESGLR